MVEVVLVVVVIIVVVLVVVVVIVVIVVEHDEDMMKEADYIIDMGPEAGSLGGEVVMVKMCFCVSYVFLFFLNVS